MKFLQRLRPEGGFTLIELLVVMLILGILAAIALPAFFEHKTETVTAEVCGVSRSHIQLPEEAGGNHGSFTFEGQKKPVLHAPYRFTVKTSDHETITSFEPASKQDEIHLCK